MSKFLIALTLVGGFSLCSAQYLSATTSNTQEGQISRTTNTEIPSDSND